MTQRPTPNLVRRCLAGGLAAVLVLAGVGMAVAGQGGGSDPGAATFAGAVGEPVMGSVPSPPEVSVDVSPSSPVAGGAAPTVPSVVPSAQPQARTAAPDPAPPSPRSVSSQASAGSSVAPPTTYTTIDVSRIFGERTGAPGGDDRIDAQGFAAELEAEVRACVETLLGGLQSSFDGNPDADRIQSFASDVVDDVLACVAGLVDVGQILSCVSEVIQEILAVVMTMDFTDLPELISEIADDMVGCISP